jgi:hypothetical protein
MKGATALAVEAAPTVHVNRQGPVNPMRFF